MDGSDFGSAHRGDHGTALHEKVIEKKFLVQEREGLLKLLITQYIYMLSFTDALPKQTEYNDDIHLL